MASFKTYGTDTYGLWTWTKLGRKNKADLLVVQLYISQENYGLYTSATQQLLQLMEEEHVEVSIRDAFRRDLKALLTDETCEKIIMGDFNNPVEHSFIQSILHDSDLVDITADYQKYGDKPFATYIRGTKKSITL